MFLKIMNLYIHDLRNDRLTLGDTLLYPKYKEGDRIKKLDIVIAILHGIRIDMVMKY